MKAKFISVITIAIILLHTSCNQATSNDADNRPPVVKELANLLASDSFRYSSFGCSVSLSSDGTIALIGSYLDDDRTNNSGAAYVYQLNGSSWVLKKKLLPSDGIDSDCFGHSVSLSSDGSTAVIGAMGSETNGDLYGAAYIFSGIDWGSETKLIASDGINYDCFGASVSLSADGSTVLIGSCASQENGFSSGAAYLFRYNGSSWTETKKLIASDGAKNHFFGNSVSLSSDGSIALIGAYGHSYDTGSAYLYSGINWSTQTKLTATDAAAGDYFGYGVSLSSDGSTALIGAHHDDDDGYSSGSAYIFSGSGWSRETKLVDDRGEVEALFGYSVSLSADGSKALIGAYKDDIRKGTAFLYTGSNWSEKTKVLASERDVYDQFGYCVSLSADSTTAFIGAIGDAEFFGSVYVYSIE